MKKFSAALFALMALVATQPARASNFDLSLNDFSIQARLVATIDEDYHGSSNFTLRLLYNERKDLALASAGLDFLSTFEGTGLDIGLGTELVAGRKRVRRDDDRNFLGLAVGTRLKYYPAQTRGAGIQARLAYVPQITAFSDLNRLLEGSFRVGYLVSPRMEIFAEYQYIRAHFSETHKETVDNDIRLGFSASF